MSPLSLIPTEDGTHTFYDPQLDVHYRSTHGARAESSHVFVQGTGLVQRPGPWVVLELGFGGALNFLNTAVHRLQQPGELHYHAVEYAPIAPSWVLQPDFAPWVPEAALLDGLYAALEAASQHKHVEHTMEIAGSKISLVLHVGHWRDLSIEGLGADALYHDPFGPKDNPEAWSEECFGWARSHLAAHGILATYAAATQVRRAMVAAGLFVAKAPGSGRKREMTLASPQPEALSGHRLLPREKYL